MTAKNQENGMCYNYQTWDDYLERTASPLSEDWAAHFGVDKTTTAIDYLDSVGKIITEPGTNYAVPEYSTDIATIKEQCAQVILEKSWQMAFASSDEEFDSLLKDMQDTCKVSDTIRYMRSIKKTVRYSLTHSMIQLHQLQARQNKISIIQQYKKQRSSDRCF